MYELSLNVMDIAQNSIRAGAKLVTVRVSASAAKDSLEIVIEDDGSGMSEETRLAVTDPFFTTRTTRKVGLGLPYYEMVAKMCGGGFSLWSEPGAGTRVTASFQLSHIDRAPLGNMGQTVAYLAGANPDVDFVYALSCDGGAESPEGPECDGGAESPGVNTFTFDTREVKALLDGVGIDTPEVIVYIEGYVNENSQKITGGISL